VSSFRKCITAGGTKIRITHIRHIVLALCDIGTLHS